MRLTRILLISSVAATIALAGCAGNSGLGLTTSSVAKPKPQPKKMVADPTCVALTAEINAARSEGTPARVHAAAKGKTRSVRVKRASIAKVAELDRLNREFQAKCSKYPQTASAPAAARKATDRVAKKASQIAKPQIARPMTTAASKPIVAVPRQ